MPEVCGVELLRTPRDRVLLPLSLGAPASSRLGPSQRR
jgi:hypothetical protein